MIIQFTFKLNLKCYNEFLFKLIEINLLSDLY
jgi:hypothetical protein